MVKINLLLIFLIFILSYILIIDCKTNLVDDVLDDYDIKYEEYLKNFFMNYLENNDLISSDKLVTEDDMKKIIIDIMLEGLSPNEVEENILTLYKDLADILINNNMNLF